MQQVDDVAAHQLRGSGHRQRDLRVQARCLLRAARPQAAAQPPDVVRVGDVERVAADTDPRHDRGQGTVRYRVVAHDRRRQLHR
ncbi:hypothetical protein FHX36_000539 [Modestobacter versicolor]|uniref:Uncharacterized protein n=1 Tax=Modestobacter versicolor TaxID=429133 RepID=A0A839Y3M8_9ACTN|nr:hypothetical protein [Modestobacter versicolor]